MIDFVGTDYSSIYDDVIAGVEKDIGTLAEGDERKIFMRSFLGVFLSIKNQINDAANQNTLTNSRDENIDVLGKDYYKSTRLKATTAKCGGIAKLSATRTEDTLIEKDKKITSDGILIFKVKNNYTIPAGELECNIELESVSTGSKYNGIDAGELKNIIDPIPYIDSIYNTEVTYGGTDIESDEDYKKRCRLAFESYSVAGPEGAYEYFAYSADNSITDVLVYSPAPCRVKILALVDNGQIPSAEIMQKIYYACSPREVRPLTDLVEVGYPTEHTYNIELTYYLDKNFSEYEGKWRKSIEGKNFNFSDGAIRDFINWQSQKIGQSINKDELQYKIQNAASYLVKNKSISGVRQINITSPTSEELLNTEVARIGTITVNYGGLQ